MTTNNQTTDQAIRKIRFLLQKELDKYDRVEIETELGVTDFMPVYLVLEKLAPVVANEVRKAETRADVKARIGELEHLIGRQLKDRLIQDRLAQLKGEITNEN